jgi:hypothetical protein
MNDTLTSTPETDRAISVGLENADRECVTADFARQLERELTKARAALKTGGLMDIIDRAGHERAHAIRERDEAEKQRDTLAEALDRIADLCQMTCMSYETQSFRATEIAINALADINQLEP